MLSINDLQSAVILTSTKARKNVSGYKIKQATIMEQLYTALGCTMTLGSLAEMPMEERLELIHAESAGIEESVLDKMQYVASQHDQVIDSSQYIADAISNHIGYLRNIVIPDIKEFMEAMDEYIVTHEAAIENKPLFDIVLVSSEAMGKDPVFGPMIQAEYLMPKMTIDKGFLDVLKELAVSTDKLNGLFPEAAGVGSSLVCDLVCDGVNAWSLILDSPFTRELSEEKIVSGVKLADAIINSPSFDTGLRMSSETVAGIAKCIKAKFQQLVKSRYEDIVRAEQNGIIVARTIPSQNPVLLPIISPNQKVPCVYVVEKSVAEFDTTALNDVIGYLLVSGKTIHTARNDAFTKDRMVVVSKVWSNHEKQLSVSPTKDDTRTLHEAAKVAFENTVIRKGKMVQGHVGLGDDLMADEDECWVLQDAIARVGNSPNPITYEVAKQLVCSIVHPRCNALETIKELEDILMPKGDKVLTTEEINERIMQVASDMITAFMFEQIGE